MAGLLQWRAPTRYELMCRFGLDEHAAVAADHVEPLPRGPRHQPRVPRGTRVRILEVLPSEQGGAPLFRVEVCDEHGKPSGYWALVQEANLTELPELGVLDWLRSFGR